jgi:pentapeptide MXKDX repeat protein
LPPSRNREIAVTLANGNLKRTCLEHLIAEQCSAIDPKEGNHEDALAARSHDRGRFAFAPTAFAADDMSKPGMSSDKMDKKTDAMSKRSDKMKKNDAMMNNKDSMAKDGMKQ